ncbi:MAG: LrgB family protein [Gammaproteobacteria bacterium]|nr:LrgB family protein [Gammaproteobacteria bacterium]MCW8924168.1 LrgB family protein [Gammaproteobacteria bacterium]
MPESDFFSIWVYLSSSPLLGLSMTVLTYSLAYRLYIYANSNSLLNPVLTSVSLLIVFLSVTDISYEAYFEGGQFIHFLLGPATVALAIPLYQQLAKLKKAWLPILITVVSGVMIGAFSSISIAWLLGASTETQLSLAPKSVTTPVAMGISELIGGLPSLTAILVVITGIIGAVIGTKIFALMRIKDDSIKGMAMGITAHGIGTARAFQVSSEMGAFSGLAMALSAFASAVTLPWLLNLVGLIN